MKIQETEGKLERSGLDNEKSFSIKASGHAFKILSDGLYSNKIGAVIRELSCNAYDSHVAAKKTDISFEVHLPRCDECWFSVKDFGIGLDHTAVINLYSTYFESTKTDDNNSIGAFGLGSKSPFSYVKSFTVISICNNKKRTYTAFISEDGTPKISLLHEGDTTEENGVEVQVPVKESDISSFKDNARTFLKHFDPAPKINLLDVNLEKRKPILSGWGWRYYGVSRYSGRLTLIQGHIAYPVDKNSFGGRMVADKIDKIISHYDMEVDFDIGELEVAASREALSYNKQTVQNILERLNVVNEELKSAFIRYTNNISGCVWDRNLELQKFRTSNYDLWELCGSDKSLITPIILDFSVFQNMIIDRKNSGKRNKKLNRFSKVANDVRLEFTASSDKHFFINDVNRPLSWFKNYFASANKDYNSQEIIIITPGTDSITDILNALGNPPTMKTSELVKPPTQQRAPRDISTRYFSIPSLESADTWYGPRWNNISGELPDSGLYLEIDHNHVYYNDLKAANYSDAIAYARKLKYFENHTGVYLFRKAQLKLIKDNTNWINAIDYIKSNINVWFEENKVDYTKYIHFTTNKFISTAESSYNLLQNHPKFQDIKNPLIIKMLNIYNEYSKISVDYNMIYAIQRTNYKIDISSVDIENFTDLVSEVYKKYPLLSRLMEKSPNDEESIGHIIDYIELIDQTVL